MNNFHRSNKVSGIYWLKKPINKLKVKVKLKPKSGLLTLPKFEEYSDNNRTVDLEPNIKEYLFEWQEKRFSLSEIQKYRDLANCVTEKEFRYHEMAKNGEPSKVFSYMHENLCTLIMYDLRNSPDCLCLNKIMESLNLNESLIENFKKSESMVHMFKSEEKLDEDWNCMHIIYDNSEYDEYSQLLIKQEATLISLYHNLTQNYLILSPDVNNIEFNPYQMVGDEGLHLQYLYEVNIIWDDDDESSEELMILLKKLYKNWEKKHRHLVNFSIPQPGIKKYYLTLEIVTASGFEMDNLYIEYSVNVPEGVQCSTALKGRTHTSKSKIIGGLCQSNFGHIIELELDVNSDLEPWIKLFFEMISVDWWNRHRTEGYGYFRLALTPGRHVKHLTCSRPEEIDTAEADSRRFFIGGCHLIKDLEVLARHQNANFINQTTGTILLRWDMISQVSTLGSDPALSRPGTSTASDVLLGAEEALRKYSKARAKLAAATKDLEDTCGFEK